MQKMFLPRKTSISVVEEKIARSYKKKLSTCAPKYRDGGFQSGPKFIASICGVCQPELETQREREEEPFIKEVSGTKSHLCDPQKGGIEICKRER